MTPVYRVAVDVTVSCARPSVEPMRARIFERQWEQAGSYLLGTGTLRQLYPERRRSRLEWKGTVWLTRFYTPWSKDRTPVTDAISTATQALMFGIQMCWAVPSQYTLEGVIEAKARWDGVTERGEYIHEHVDGEWTSRYEWPSERTG